MSRFVPVLRRSNSPVKRRRQGRCARLGRAETGRRRRRGGVEEKGRREKRESCDGG